MNNTELPKDIHMEGKKTVDINVILNDNVHIEVELNRDYFNKVRQRNFRYIDKMASFLIENGEDADKTDKILYQLNLNVKEKQIKFGKDIIVPYGTETGKIYEDNKFMVLKYLEYYRRLYYNEGDRSEEVVWLTALTSTTFSELYEILSNILSETEKEKLMGDVIKMSMKWEDFPLHEWQREKFEAMERRAELEEFKRREEKALKKALKKGIKQGLEQGIEQGIEKGIEQGIAQGNTQKSLEIAKKMLAMNIDIETIIEATSLSKEEIEGLK